MLRHPLQHSDPHHTICHRVWIRHALWFYFDQSGIQYSFSVEELHMKTSKVVCLSLSLFANFGFDIQKLRQFATNLIFRNEMLILN